jgi:hypothetical protein
MLALICHSIKNKEKQYMDSCLLIVHKPYFESSSAASFLFEVFQRHVSILLTLARGNLSVCTQRGQCQTSAGTLRNGSSAKQSM